MCALEANEENFKKEIAPKCVLSSRDIALWSLHSNEEVQAPKDSKIKYLVCPMVINALEKNGSKAGEKGDVIG